VTLPPPQESRTDARARSHFANSGEVLTGELVDVPPGPAPGQVAALATLLAFTSVATVAVELINWWYAEDGGFGLAVRTGWALLRALGFLILIWHLRRGRAAARPFGLILAVTTIFAVARLVVPRQGFPAAPGIIGFAVIVTLCLTIVALLYRSQALAGWLRNHPKRLVIDRNGISRKEVKPQRHVSGWLLTSRVAAFSYSPLMMVPAIVAIAEVFDGKPGTLPLVVIWLVIGFSTSYAVLFTTFFLLRGKSWARGLMIMLTCAVLLIDLPLCWLLLGADGLVRDGLPQLSCALLTFYALWRAARQPSEADLGRM
jgi:hypothetical protein